MIIIHENLPAEAQYVADIIKSVLGIESFVIERKLDDMFIRCVGFDGYKVDLTRPLGYGTNAVLVLTARDIYTDNRSKKDSWIFGAYSGPGQGGWVMNAGEVHTHMVVSTCRLKGTDSTPNPTGLVPNDYYLKRVSRNALHEIGHGIVNGYHLKPAAFVNVKTGNRMPLGEHCSDNACVMYEVIDIKTPPPSEEYLLMGNLAKYDAGLDDHLKRVYPDWFCVLCRASIRITDAYKKNHLKEN